MAKREISQYNNIVTKSNKLVEEGIYKLDAQEQRVVALLTSYIHPEDEDFKDYEFQIKDFIGLLDTSSKNYYTQLKKVTKTLISKTLILPEKDGLLQVSWLSSAKYFEKKGYVRLRFDPALKKYLLKLKECFTSYKLINVLKLRSKYAFRFYEMMKKNELLGEVKYSIKFLRERFMLEKNELKQWNDFKRFCIEPAIKEINKKTDLKIKYKPIKELSRAFTHIIFYIQKKNIEPEIIDNKESYYTIIKLIKDEKNRKKKTIQTAITKYLKKKGFDYVRRNILYANEKAEKNYRNFLIQSLKNDWAMAWYEDLQEEQEEAIEAQKKREKEEKFREWVKIQRKKAEERAKEQLSAMPPEEYKKKFDETKKRMSGILSNLDDSIVVGAMVYEKVRAMVEQLVQEGKMKQSIAEEILKIQVKV